MLEKEFLEFIKEELDIEEEITLKTKFRDELEDWSSLMGFSLMIVIENETGKRVAPNDFLKLETLGDIYNLMK